MVSPKDLGKNVQNLLKKKLKQLVEGSCSRRYGYIIAVMHIYEESMEHGRICEGTGDATFPMKYSALVFKPFRNEVTDALVDTVTKDGFFAKAGPLSIFVSYQNMPSGTEFDHNAIPPLFSGAGVLIQKDTCVRLKLLNTRIEADGTMVRASPAGPLRSPRRARIDLTRSVCAHPPSRAPSRQHAVGTIKEDFLGPL